MGGAYSECEQQSGPSMASVIGVVMLLTMVVASLPTLGQEFNSGSNGSDGTLHLTTPGEVLFDPRDFSPPLDPDGDGVYHFTTINVGPGVIVKLKAVPLGLQPVVWLAEGDVVINGVLDLNGEDGHSEGVTTLNTAAIGGAGGHEEGRGARAGLSATPGLGPGGGVAALRGGGAGHVNLGHDGGGCVPGTAYGNAFALPMLGGSGGGGSTFIPGSGGGAGGGALLIGSSTSIKVNGAITANGGHGRADGIGGSTRRSGAGSGGTIRLIASRIEGSGLLSAQGGTRVLPDGNLAVGTCEGSGGQVRLEAFSHQFGGTIRVDNPPRFSNALEGMVRLATPGLVFPPNPAPVVRVVSVARVPVPDFPTGAFDPADLTINQGGEVTFEIEGRNVPIGTVVHFRLYNESEGLIEFNSEPLAGANASSTSASATATVPHGFSRVTVEATF